MAVWVHQEGQSQRRLSNLHRNHQSHCQRDPKTVTYLNIEDFPLFLFCYQPMPGICCTKKHKKQKKKDKGKAFSVSLFTSWINQARKKDFSWMMICVKLSEKVQNGLVSIFQDYHLLKVGKNIEIFNPPNFILLKQKMNTGKQC